MQRKKGQSLVEMAIAMPLLLIMLLGVFEVGRAIRNYMIIINASREAARFAAKPSTLDFKAYQPDDIGFGKVISHTLVTIGNTLPDFAENGFIIISLYEMPAMFPCDPEQRVVTANDKWANCNCALAPLNLYSAAVVRHPGNEPFLTHSWPITLSSRIDPYVRADKFLIDHLAANCIAGKTAVDAIPQVEQLVIAEVGYLHSQLGFPLFTVIVPEQFELYMPTTMRYSADRENQ